LISQSLAAIFDLASRDHRNELKELIKHLFPTVEWAIDGTQYADQFNDEWYRDLRVCSTKMFDRYFRFAVSNQELSQSVVQKLLRARGNRDILKSQLETLHSRGLLGIAIEELAVYQDEIAPDQVEPFLTALFDVTDFLTNQRNGFAEVPAEVRVWFLGRRSLEKIETGKRLDLLANALENTDGLYMAIEFVVLASTPADEADVGMFSVSELAILKVLALKKIQAAAISGTLAHHPKVATMLGLWRSWGTSSDEVESYTKALTEKPEGTLQLLKSFVLRSVRYGAGEHVGTERFYIRRKDVEVLMPMDTLDFLVNHLPPNELNAEDQRAVNAFRKAMERFKAGRSDDDPLADD
jgi:predicted KAP-like P-loop ATPase